MHNFQICINSFTKTRKQLKIIPFDNQDILTHFYSLDLGHLLKVTMLQCVPMSAVSVLPQAAQMINLH